MSGLARLFLKGGARVSGSDLKESSITAELKAQGARVFIGHRPQNLDNQDAVIFSSAIKQDNPEIIRAKELGLPLLQRAEALAHLMAGKRTVAVAGSHGKTTTASLVSCLLLEAGLCPTVAVGGILKNIESNACLGEGDFFVAEADESDGSFLHYRPRYSIITNIDREHLDYYGTFDNELRIFRDFIGRTEKEGCLFACYDDANLRQLLAGYKDKFRFFGLDPQAHIHAANIEFDGLQARFDCFSYGRLLKKFNLSLGGRHNISNALGVIALGLELGISCDTIGRALQEYKGARRRLEVKFRNRDYLLLDDYAHHPSEIKVTLQAAGNLKAARRIGVFQPHRYSRTKLLLDDFAVSFGGLDKLIITDIYAAGEPALEGVNAGLLLQKLKERSGIEVIFLPKEEIAGYLEKIILPGDLMITLGAGDIVKVSDELARKLAEKN